MNKGDTSNIDLSSIEPSYRNNNSHTLIKNDQIPATITEVLVDVSASQEPHGDFDLENSIPSEPQI